MDLTKLTDQPELTVAIGGQPYHFSELPIGKLGALQTWINAHTPHPIRSLAGQLDGLPESDRQYLLEQARRDAKSWPPQVGTAEGAAALLGTEPGQKTALGVGLSVHHPETNAEDVERIFRDLRRDATREAKRARKAGRAYDGDGAARRIFAVLFGLDDPADDMGDDAPKG